MVGDKKRISPERSNMEVTFPTKRLLSDEEMNEVVTGEAITLTAVMAVMAIMIVGVVIYCLFKSEKGSTTVPGGWKFSWG